MHLTYIHDTYLLLIVAHRRLHIAMVIFDAFFAGPCLAVAGRVPVEPFAVGVVAAADALLGMAAIANWIHDGSVE